MHLWLVHLQQAGAVLEASVAGSCHACSQHMLCAAYALYKRTVLLLCVFRLRWPRRSCLSSRRRSQQAQAAARTTGVRPGAQGAPTGHHCQQVRWMGAVNLAIAAALLTSAAANGGILAWSMTLLLCRDHATML